MNRALQHVRANAVAYLALFVALGGTGYAATNIPRNSVGTSQIKNGAVTPPKLNSRLIGGTIRAWAYVSSTGHAYAVHGFSRVFSERNQPGVYALNLTDQNIGGCATVADVSFDVHTGGGANGYAVSYPPQGPPRQRPSSVQVVTFGSTGVATPLPFAVEVLC